MVKGTYSRGERGDSAAAKKPQQKTNPPRPATRARQAKGARKGERHNKREMERKIYAPTPKRNKTSTVYVLNPRGR